jgi:transcriptional regulator with PAS, ATPase and Fis domain
MITADDLPANFRQTGGSAELLGIEAGMTLAQVEAELIRQTLLKVTSNREDAAKRLGISRRALQYKIQRYGLGDLPKAKR